MAQGPQALVDLASRMDAEAQRHRADQREIHERLAARMLTAVRGQIHGLLNDAHGRVAGWQDKCVGSGGGYAAVRPIASSSGANSPGAITNYLENGHAIRSPGANAARYKPRIKVLYVNGRGFYNAARRALPRMLQREVEQWGNDVASRLGGR